jgi:4-alpha-glucanotransferase
MSHDLSRLARRYGVATGYLEQTGRHRRVSDATIRAVLGAIGVPLDDSQAPNKPAVAPSPSLPRLPKDVRCHIPDWLTHGRAWGIATQLYQLRSARNWGIGDFEDLARLAEMAGAAGADFVGVNPLHALFLAAPEHCSPFSPSNRRFLNPLYIAVDMVPGIRRSDLDRKALSRLRAMPLVDYAGVGALKLATLRRLWRRWQNAETNRAARARFADFRGVRGEALHRHACFEALSVQMRREGHGAGWQGWPRGYRRPESARTKAFAAEHDDDVDFHAWLQWLADEQLAGAAARARAASMRIGLYLDLAVGEVPDGSATWGDPALMVTGAHIGAPPDAFNMDGQDWGLSPPSPVELRRRALAPYCQLLADAMRHAGALRIDHVMALRQLYFVPVGHPPTEGTYVRYPMARMLCALASASRARHAIVIGEDLGTVPHGFRELMARAEVQSYRLLYFERERGRPRRPSRYPGRALACLSTHDLPPFLGWWHGEDIDRRVELGLSSMAAAERQRQERRRDRKLLLSRFARAGLLPAAVAEAVTDEIPPAAVASVTAAAHRYLAAAPSRLFCARLEDLAGERLPVNVPGVADAYPNWRPKLRLALEDLERAPIFAATTQALAAVRPRPP